MCAKNKFNIRDKGLRMLELKDFFTKYTDEDYEIGINELVEKFSDYMVEKYKENFEVTDETLISDIKLLNFYGFEVNVNVNKYGKKMYSNISKLFDKQEITLILNEISSSKFLCEKDIAIIEEKISSTISEKLKVKLKNFNKINKSLKTQNSKVKYSLFNINDAVERKKTVTFKYNGYFVENDKICTRPKHGIKKYEIEPYGLAISSNKCYFIGKDLLDEGQIKHFRVDLLDDVQIGKKEISSRCNFDMEAHLNRSFNMYAGGPIEKVKLKVNKAIINNIVDYFGIDKEIEEIDENYFFIESELYINSGLVSWILRFGENIEVIQPEMLKNRVKEKIKKLYSLYFKETK